MDVRITKVIEHIFTHTITRIKTYKDLSDDIPIYKG